MDMLKSFLNNTVLSKILPKPIRNETNRNEVVDISLMQGFDFQYLLKYLVRNLDSIPSINWITEDIFDVVEFSVILKSRIFEFLPESFYEIVVGDKSYSLILSKPENTSNAPRYKLELLFEERLIMEYFYSGDDGLFYGEVLGDIFLNFDLNLDYLSENWVFSSSGNPLILISRNDSSYVLILYEFYHIHYIWKNF